MGKTLEVVELRQTQNNKIRYLNSKIAFDEEIIETFLYQSSQGLNINKQVKKGKRSYARLISLKYRLKKWEDWLKEYCNKKITEAREEDLVGIYNMLDEGKITSKSGERYKSIREYVRDIKTFWHWYQKYMKKNYGEAVDDITEDLSGETTEKPSFHYFDFNSMKKMVDQSPYNYKVLMWFLYDTGIRAPKEANNIKVSDLSEENGTNYLQIRDEVSKTFGRKIKLILSAEIVKEWIMREKLKSTDYLFNINPSIVNAFLNRLGYKVLGFGEEYTLKKGNRTHYRYRGGLTMYDFRHASACYWLSRYKHESAFMYRFGWRRRKMIEYYTEFLGMKDTITEEDLVDAETKTILEKELEIEKRKREMLEEEMAQQRKEQADIKSMLKELIKKGVISKK